MSTGTVTSPDVLVMTKQQWDSMAEKDRAFFRSIGINGPTVKEKKTPTAKTGATLGLKNPITKANRLSLLHTAPKEYWIEVVSVCECCDGVETKFGKMALPHDRAKALEFVEQEIPEGELPKRKKLFPANCVKCSENLMKLSKEELVGKVMHVTKLAILKGWL